MVAVKVRHPGVGEVIARDFGLMMRAARIAAWLPSLASLRLQDSLEQFSAPLREQVLLTELPVPAAALAVWACSSSGSSQYDIDFSEPA